MAIDRDIQERIKHALYPITLKPHIMELIGIKMWELSKQYRDDSQRVQNKGDVVERANLSVEELTVVEHYERTKQAYENARAAFEERFVIIYGAGSVVRRLSDAQREYLRKVKQERAEAVNATHKANVAALLDVARKLAQAHIAASREKVPTALLAELDAVGVDRQLPAADVPAES